MHRLHFLVNNTQQTKIKQPLCLIEVAILSKLQTYSLPGAYFVSDDESDCEEDSGLFFLSIL